MDVSSGLGSKGKTSEPDVSQSSNEGVNMEQEGLVSQKSDIRSQLDNVRKQHRIEEIILQLELDLKSKVDLSDGEPIRPSFEQAYSEVKQVVSSAGKLSQELNESAQTILQAQVKQGADAYRTTQGLSNLFKGATCRLKFYQKRLENLDRIRETARQTYLDNLRQAYEIYEAEMDKLRKETFERRAEHDRQIEGLMQSGTLAKYRRNLYRLAAALEV